MSRPLHVLLLEDCPDDARLILHELRRAGFEPVGERVETEPDFLARLDPVPEVILSDYHLPQFDALRALDLVRERGLDVPIIIVTGALGDEEAAAECLRRGAADYLLKDRLARLGQAVTQVLDQKRRRDEQRRAEQALRDSEARKSAILETALDGVIVMDHQGRIVEFNAAAEAMFGYSRAEAEGRPMAELIIPPAWREPHRRGLAHYLATGEGPLLGQRVELTAMRAGGAEFPVELAVTRVPVDGPPLFAGRIRDLTERKQAEEQMKLAAELQGRNLELVRSNQELDEFASTVAHDLKEPLRGIQNYATFLVEDYGDQLGPEGRSKLETLKKLAQRMNDLINSVLEFSRVGRVDLATRATDLNELLGEILDSLRFTLQEQGVEVRIPRPLPTLRCDRVRIGEVFRNLITNAVKYNDKPEKWVEIGYTEESGPEPAGDGNGRRQPSVVLYVRDNGIGIREKHFEDIYRIFRRLHPRDKFGGGTGVGLAIVKKIIERHGGRIWVESVYGQGTTFFFTLGEMGGP